MQPFLRLINRGSIIHTIIANLDIISGYSCHASAFIKRNHSCRIAPLDVVAERNVVHGVTLSKPVVGFRVTIYGNDCCPATNLAFVVGVWCIVTYLVKSLDPLARVTVGWTDSGVETRLFGILEIQLFQ